MKDWGREVVGFLITELNLSSRDYVSQELVEHRGKGNPPFLGQSLRGFLELLVGLEHHSCLHIPEYISWYNLVKRVVHMTWLQTREGVGSMDAWERNLMTPKKFRM